MKDSNNNIIYYLSLHKNTSKRITSISKFKELIEIEMPRIKTYLGRQRYGILMPINLILPIIIIRLNLLKQLVKY